MVTNAIIFGILLGITGIGYLFRAGLFIILAGLGMIVFGFTLWSTYEWLSIVLVLVGMLLTWLGFKS